MKIINAGTTLFFFILTLVATTLLFAATPENSNSYAKDSAITTYVKGKIALNKPIASLHIKVVTNNGVVSLNGRVDSEEQASSLVELAQSAPGVKDVDTTYLTVKQSGQPLTDAVITAKVKGTFLREKLFTNADVAAMSIGVETRNGVVYLSGTADNLEQANNAVKLAGSVAGVSRVESAVKVQE